jgi:enoyl-CoA hydratase
LSKQTILLNKTEGIATIYLNRPEKKNAMTLEMWKQIPKLLADMENDKEINSVIIRGVNEEAFCAGADIEEFSIERVNASRSQNYDNQVTAAGDALENFSKPIIAMIEGPCIGGGSEIALACDIRFSSETGIFGITPAKIGLIYGVPQTKRLIDAVGPSRAKDILFSGRFLDPTEAYQFGLIDRVYPTESIVEETYNYAKLLGNRSQSTIKAAKKISQAILAGTVDKEFDHNTAYFSNDIHEGIKAFKEKRKPQFSV